MNPLDPRNVRTPVRGWPEYEIEPDGTLWRVAPSVVDGRKDRGPVPRKLKPLMMGTKGRRVPSFKLSRSGIRQTRTLSSLLREHFPWNFAE